MSAIRCGPRSARLADSTRGPLRACRRALVEIWSTGCPLFDRNPQKHLDDIFEADEADFVTQLHREYRAPEHAS